MINSKPTELPPPLPTTGQTNILHHPGTEPRLCKMAVGSFVLSVLGFMTLGLPAILGIILGHIASIRIKNSEGELRGRGWAIAGCITGYLIVMITAFVIFMGFKSFRERREADENPFVYISNPPAFEGIMQRADEAWVDDVKILQVRTRGSAPAQNMDFRIYLPAGIETVKEGTLPCVLIAPAGTNLITGAELEALDEFSYHDEALPYAQAGMITVLYSLDGGGDYTVFEDEELVVAAMAEEYDEFRAAHAGILNARHAMEFVLSELPMVNPNQIYSAGHSSAGTLSLLFAMYEPRVAGCIAYAPGVDLESFHAELLVQPFINLTFSNISNFIRKSSPTNQAILLTCPTFLFQSKEDGIVPFEAFSAFVDKLNTETTRIDLEVMIVEEDGHYYPMLSKGIPAGISWIQSKQ